MRVQPYSDPPIVRIFRWIACVCLIWAAVLSIERLWFLKHAVHTHGTVLRFAIVPHASGDQPTFRVVFTYALPDGRVVQATSPTQQNAAFPYGEAGASLPVLYNPAHPERALPDRWMDLWFAQAILGGTGAFFWIFASILAYVLRHSEDGARQS